MTSNDHRPMPLYLNPTPYMACACGEVFTAPDAFTVRALHRQHRATADSATPESARAHIAHARQALEAAGGDDT